MMKSMDDLFYNLLEDVYYAEKQLVKTLPKLAKKSTSPELEKAFMDHRSETEQHVRTRFGVTHEIAMQGLTLERLGQRIRRQTDRSAKAIVGYFVGGREKEALGRVGNH